MSAVEGWTMDVHTLNGMVEIILILGWVGF